MNNSEIKDKTARLLRICLESEASDLHISPGHRPILRIDGELKKISDEDKLTEEEAREISFSLMTEKQEETFKKNKELDYSYSFGENGRFRVNTFIQMGGVSSALRRIPSNIKNLDELNLPSHLYQFSQANQGFVLVTGPTGHGKSTTLAALINRIVLNEFKHIVTIEDPIEYVFDKGRSLVDQREVGHDTDTFNAALKSVFRQDPDVIMVGEMRDSETMETAITAAETGHLVFSTLHTNSASQTINRIVDTFPGTKQDQIRAQLSTSLLGVVSQRLLPRIGGGVIPACEIMKNNSAVANLIRENKIHELDMAIENTADDNMITLDHHLRDLVEANEVDLEVALNQSLNPQHLQKLLT